MYRLNATPTARMILAIACRTSITTAAVVIVLPLTTGGPLFHPAASLLKRMRPGLVRHKPGLAACFPLAMNAEGSA